MWHKRLEVKPAAVVSANFALLSRLQLVTRDEQSESYSVLIEPLNEFTIYLPPVIIDK